ncbi:hypothetical protein KIPB_002947 [Kipferlia bialata]|uniref:Uncharacterized protein n=1 Tax=Kipferlia bialata TaxID=797122 RepID=A0A9K3CT83_9EUKA|nr:hypothetical protein KIPB_002947 [Kipferlia bialata]|eukprot:g2947.t1
MGLTIKKRRAKGGRGEVMAPHILQAVTAGLVYVVVLFGLTMIQIYSNVVEAYIKAFNAGDTESFWNHTRAIEADTNPAGCFAMLLPFCYIVGEIVMCTVLYLVMGGRKGAEREREATTNERETGDVVQEVPIDQESVAVETEGEGEGEGERERVTDEAALLTPALRGLCRCVLICMVVLFCLSIASGFFTYTADRLVTYKFRRMTVERGFTEAQAEMMVKDAGDIGELSWVVLNTGAGNSFSDYFKGVLGSEFAAPIMALFPYAVGGMVGTGVGMYLGLLHATVECPSLNASVRSKFKHLMWMPIVMWGIAGLWALTDTPGSFKGSQFLLLFGYGSQFLQLFGLVDEAEKLTDHTGNYELFLCACQLPAIYLAIRWVDLGKTHEEKEVFARRSVWIRRFGTYSLSCFVYDGVYYGFVQWLASLYIPSCAGPEGVGLEECTTLGGFFHMLIVGLLMVFAVLYVFDITHGVLSLDYWLSAITAVGVYLIGLVFSLYFWVSKLISGAPQKPDAPKREMPSLLKMLVPRIPMNHIDVQVVPILSANAHKAKPEVLGTVQGEGEGKREEGASV